MDIVVKKYGGTSLATTEHISRVADAVLQAKEKGESVVLVLSAMAGETNRLNKLASEFGDIVHTSGYDLLLATGEQISIALMSIALEKRGIKSETLFAPNLGLFTDDFHGGARVRNIETTKILEALSKNKIPVIAGFQGLTTSGKVSTLGRGGSDITAVAIAAALKASRCDIATDVDGVYTADPTQHLGAKKMESISYEELLELADAGAKVVHPRAVEIAAKFKVTLNVHSSFNNNTGTLVQPEDDLIERPLISAVTSNINEAKISIRRVPDKVGIVARIFKQLSASNIDIDLIIQNVSRDGFTDLSFTVPKVVIKKALSLSEFAAKEVGAGLVEADCNIAKVSVVGVGMRSNPGVAFKIFDTLADKNIPIQMIGTSEIKVSMVTGESHSFDAVDSLLTAFNLKK
ncbi:MAG: aspartate kinase [Pseudomonadota bacterium]